MHPLFSLFDIPSKMLLVGSTVYSHKQQYRKASCMAWNFFLLDILRKKLRRGFWDLDFPMFIELISKPPTPRCKKNTFLQFIKIFLTHNLTKSIIFHTAGLSFLFYIFAVIKILLIELRSHPPCWYHPNPLGEDAYYSHCCKTLTDENIGIFHSAMTCVVQETLDRKHREKVQFCRII